MPNEIVHMSLDIRGCLENGRRDKGRSFRGFTNEDGSAATESEVHAFLLDQLAMGRKLLPMSKDCEGFDYQTGCPGHKDTP